MIKCDIGRVAICAVAVVGNTVIGNMIAFAANILDFLGGGWIVAGCFVATSSMAACLVTKGWEKRFVGGCLLFVVSAACSWEVFWCWTRYEIQDFRPHKAALVRDACGYNERDERFVC